MKRGMHEEPAAAAVVPLIVAVLHWCKVEEGAGCTSGTRVADSKA